jgi:DNA repair protein RadA/Sms
VNARSLSMEELRSLLRVVPREDSREDLRAPQTRKLYACAFCHSRFSALLVRCSKCRTVGTVSIDYRGAEKKTSSEEPEESFEESFVEEGSLEPQSLANVPDVEVPRITSGISGFDRVLGGGFARGKVILVSGKPGVGKSTALLGALSHPAEHGYRVLYDSSEEDNSQVANRGRRINASMRIEVSSETDLYKALQRAEGYDILVLDSAQMFVDSRLSTYAPGSITQVKNVGVKAVEFARRTNCAVVILAQTNRIGELAGPNHIAHVVDAVFQFKRMKGGKRQFVCAEKNRTGQAPALWRCRMDDNGKIVNR